MHYLLAFLGLIAVAIVLATSPLVIRLIEFLLPAAHSDRPPARTANAQAVERSEVRDELRRLTAALETDRRSAGRVKDYGKGGE
jgi:hypothetical protein